MEQELLTCPEHLSSPPVLSGVRVAQSLVLCVCFVDHCLFFFFWSLCCLFFVDLRILIIPLVSPKFFTEVPHKNINFFNRFHKSELDRADSSLECFNLYTMNAGSSQILYGGKSSVAFVEFYREGQWQTRSVCSKIVPKGGLYSANSR